MFRSGVRRNVRRARLAGNRSDINDATPTLFEHRRHGRTRAVISAGQIHRQMALPERFVGLQESCCFNDTRVVYQNVRASTKLLAHPTERALHAL